MNNLFRHFAQKTAHIVGSSWTFIIALLAVLTWLVSGPLFNFSNTWQLLINTGTTIITFLVVFLIQNTQNRDTKAIHLKLDELIYSMKKARDSLVDIEDASDEELASFEQEFRELKAKYQKRRK